MAFVTVPVPMSARATHPAPATRVPQGFLDTEFMSFASGQLARFDRHSAARHRRTWVDSYLRTDNGLAAPCVDWHPDTQV
jgi:hypothetical protein